MIVRFGLYKNNFKRIQAVERTSLRSVAAHTLNGGKRNDNIRKSVNVFSINKKKEIELLTNLKEHLNDSQM